MRSEQMDYDCPCDACFVSVGRLCITRAPQSFVPGSLQLRVLRFSLLQDGDVPMRGVGNTGLRYFGAELLSWRRITSEVLSVRARARDLPLGAQENPVI